MRFPCESISAVFLPSLRIRIAHNLRTKGLSQNKIAQLLGVKQPVIVSYLQKKFSETGDSRLNHHLDTLAESVSNMIYVEEGLEHPMRTICTKCKSLRVNGPICSIHKEQLPELKGFENCDICSGYDALPSLQERSKVIQSLKEILSEIQKNDKFYFWVPEIGSQIASCDDDAKELDDIASFPGRIIKVKEVITSVSSPEFGSSKTAATLLLWIRKIIPNIKWLMTIKNKPPLKEILSSNKIKFLETESLDIRRNQILENVEKEIRTKRITLILDQGGPGYEAICYLFASTKEEIIDVLSIIS